MGQSLPPVTSPAEGPRSALTEPFRILLQTWKRIRAWRRIHFTAGGLAFTMGVFAVGFAAVNTGNNLLHLLLGAMLGFIVVSGWTSERMIRDLVVERETPKGVTAGQELRIGYRVRNRRKRMASVAVEIVEQGLSERAFLTKVPAGGSTTARSYQRFAQRGVYPLETVTLSTGFPFGLFIKERDLTLPGELVIWPRSDLDVRPPLQASGRIQRHSPAERGAPGTRGEYRSLHEYRPGDDARDIHWKSSARMRAPVVREYEADAAEDLWICLDTGGEPGDAAESLVEVAASLAARASGEGRSFALVGCDLPILPGQGPAHLDLVLDALARVVFTPDAPPPAPPPAAASCVLVSLRGRGGPEYIDSYTARLA